MPKKLDDPRKNILLEVERLLNAGGYDAVTVRAVAQGCGVGVGTVYNYFPSKEAMLAEYRLAEWLDCVAVIQQASSQGAEGVAHTTHLQLLQYADSHMAVFRSAVEKKDLGISFTQFRGMLRSQLAAPLRPFCKSDFAAMFAADALLTWTLEGKEFHEIWDLLSPVIKE